MTGKMRYTVVLAAPAYAIKVLSCLIDSRTQHVRGGSIELIVLATVLTVVWFL